MEHNWDNDSGRDLMDDGRVCLADSGRNCGKGNGQRNVHGGLTDCPAGNVPRNPVRSPPHCLRD